MKKLVALTIVFTMALSLTACGSNKEAEETATTKNVQTETQVAKEKDTVKAPENKTREKEVEKETTAEDKELTAKEPSVERVEPTVEEPSVKFVEPTAEDFEYHYDAAYEGIVITAYNGGAPAIRIPAELDGDPVRQVSFNKHMRITHIELPDSVTEIGGSAFSGCSSLTEITIPNGVTEIRDNAFVRCSSLVKITIPDSVTTIGNYAFEDCSSLTEITIPNGVTEIGGSAFLRCTSLRNLTIPDSVTWIYTGTFIGCDGLKVTYQGQEYTYANEPGWWGY